MDWIHDINEVNTFRKVLMDACILDSDDVIQYHDDPAGFNEFYLLWVEYGKPLRSDYKSDWDGFSEAARAVAF